jgi:hypothetical protein
MDLIDKRLITQLDRFDFNYTVEGAHVTIKLGYSQQIIVDFAESGKIKMRDRLKAWNPLTGMIETSLKNAMVLISFVMLLFLIFSIEIVLTSQSATYVVPFIFVLAYYIIWVVYLNVRLSNFKNTLRGWLA